MRIRRLAALAIATVVAVAACDARDAGENPAANRPTAPDGKARPAARPDFNGDGYQDAFHVLGDSSGPGVPSGYGRLLVFLGGADGLRPTGRPLEGYASPVAVDLDLDGRTDLVLNRRSAGTVVLRGTADGLGSRQDPIRVPGEDPAHPLTVTEVGDFDGDGHPDLFGLPEAQGSDGDGRLLLGPFTRGRPRAVRTLAGTSRDRTATAATRDLTTTADFDRDGRTDLLLLRDYDPDAEIDEEDLERLPPRRAVRFFFGTPDGRGLVEDTALSARLSEEVPYEGTEVRVLDLDGDGHPDLLPPAQGGRTRRDYLRGGPDGIRPGRARLNVETGSVGTPLLSAHVTGAADRNTVSMVRPGLRGRVQLTRLTASGGTATLALGAFVDLDTDGMPGEVFVSDIGPRDHFGDFLTVLDADGDGHDDVLAGEPFTGPGDRYGGYWYLPGSAEGLRVEDVRYWRAPELGL